MINSIWKDIARAVIVVSYLCSSASFASFPAVNGDRIVPGQSAAFDGPAQALGLGMREGLFVGGAPLTYGPGDNQGMDSVYLSGLQKDGSYKYVDRLSKAVDTAELS